MIKLSKACVLILLALLIAVLSYTAAGAFAFSFPQGTVVAGPGLGSGPTVFNTYSHDLTTIGSGASADVAADVGGAAVSGWVPPLGPACPAIPGIGALPVSLPFGWGQAANEQIGTQAAEDNTFATSFYTAGGAGAWPGLCNAYISGNDPQQFALQFF